MSGDEMSVNPQNFRNWDPSFQNLKWRESCSRLFVTELPCRKNAMVIKIIFFDTTSFHLQSMENFVLILTASHRLRWKRLCTSARIGNFLSSLLDTNWLFSKRR